MKSFVQVISDEYSSCCTVCVFCVAFRFRCGSDENFYGIQEFFSPFVKLRKATLSFVMPLCPSVSPPARIEQLGFYWTDFHTVLYLCMTSLVV